MTPNPWRRHAQPLTIAHRGHSIEVPENTIAAYTRAIELGVEMIECDVNLTRDGTLAMIHDTTLERTTNGAGRVRDATWDELQRLDAGSWMRQEFAGLRVPSTAETLELAREAGILMCFEVKGFDDPNASEIAQALIALLVEREALGWAFMSSYYHGALAQAKRQAPDLLLAPERLPDNVPVDPPEALRQARALGAPVLQNYYTLITPELVRTLHDADVALWSWTTNSEQSLIDGVNAGVDGVMGDDVRTMFAVLNRMCPPKG